MECDTYGVRYKSGAHTGLDTNGVDTQGMGYIRSGIYGMGYTWSGIHTEWDAHGVGYTRSGIYTEWDIHGVEYTE